MSEIDIADVVHHAPSGEDWVVARVTGDDLYPAGWPPTLARLHDCTLVKKATDSEREFMLGALRKLPYDDARYVPPEEQGE